MVRAMLCRKWVVLLVPLPLAALPPPSQTMTLSNLMFEIAWAAVLARASRCSSMRS